MKPAPTAEFIVLVRSELTHRHFVQLVTATGPINAQRVAARAGRELQIKVIAAARANGVPPLGAPLRDINYKPFLGETLPPPPLATEEE